MFDGSEVNQQYDILPEVSLFFKVDFDLDRRLYVIGKGIP